jgi:Rod binding domain-containing protein
MLGASGISGSGDLARALAPDAGGRAEGAFSASLSSALGGERSRASGQDPREAAEELVAMTFVQPILSELRSSSMAAEPFKPTDAEQRFGALYDAEVARRIVSGSGFPLVDALARQMRERSALKEAPEHAPRTPLAEHIPIDRLA